VARLLVIDDERSVTYLVCQAFKASSVDVMTADNGEDALAALDDGPIDVVLLDIVLPDDSGLELYQRIRQHDARVPVIFMTGQGTSDTAIDAMKLGAYDYIVKPLDVARLRDLVEQALESRRLIYAPVRLNDGNDETTAGELLQGRSPAMLEVFKAVGRVAAQDVAVLIRGESGTGKELVASAIYQHSPRSHLPFLAVNCAAIPDTLLETELFGHDRGAFTGADRLRAGKFEQCRGGTLFLDEIGDMSPLLQGKVLRVLQEQRFERVGGDETIETDVRIISATNRDLEAMVAEGTFRPDLYYRLNGYTIVLPPLRERSDDLLMLTERFLARYARELGKDVDGIAPAALELLIHYPWPGNVRELQTVIKKSLLQATGPVLLPEFLPKEIVSRPKRLAPTAPENLPPSDLSVIVDGLLREGNEDLYAETLAMMDRYLLTRVLQITEGNQSNAAKMLRITRGCLRRKLQELGMSVGIAVSQYGDASEKPEKALISA
jgi:DNA-binding NtrC family response regulator